MSDEKELSPLALIVEATVRAGGRIPDSLILEAQAGILPPEDAAIVLSAAAPEDRERLRDSVDRVMRLSREVVLELGARRVRLGLRAGASSGTFELTISDLPADATRIVLSRLRELEPARVLELPRERSAAEPPALRELGCGSYLIQIWFGELVWTEALDATW